MTLHEDDMHVSQKINDSPVLMAIARLSMVLALPTIGALFYLYSGWQDTRFAAMESQIVGVQKSATDASDKSTKVSDRLYIVETKQTQDAASSDKFQSATLTRLDRVQDSIVGLSNAVAALTATLQSISEMRQEQAKTAKP